MGIFSHENRARRTKSVTMSITYARVYCQYLFILIYFLFWHRYCISLDRDHKLQALSIGKCTYIHKLLTWDNRGMKLNTIKRLYNKLNADAFSGLLEMPRIEFTRSRISYGIYTGNSLQINPRYAKGEVALETLFHEMTHQFVDEILQATDSSDHGFIFWAWYDRLIPEYITPDFIGID